MLHASRPRHCPRAEGAAGAFLQQVKAAAEGTELATALGEKHRVAFRLGPGGGNAGATVWGLPAGAKSKSKPARVLESIDTCKVAAPAVHAPSPPSVCMHACQGAARACCLHACHRTSGAATGLRQAWVRPFCAPLLQGVVHIIDAVLEAPKEAPKAKAAQQGSDGGAQAAGDVASRAALEDARQEEDPAAQVRPAPAHAHA
jgi:hypothetical protein